MAGDCLSDKVLHTRQSTKMHTPITTASATDCKVACRAQLAYGSKMVVKGKAGKPLTLSAVQGMQDLCALPWGGGVSTRCTTGGHLQTCRRQRKLSQATPQLACISMPVCNFSVAASQWCRRKWAALMAGAPLLDPTSWHTGLTSAKRASMPTIESHCMQANSWPTWCAMQQQQLLLWSQQGRLLHSQRPLLRGRKPRLPSKDAWIPGLDPLNHLPIDLFLAQQLQEAAGGVLVHP